MSEKSRARSQAYFARQAVLEAQWAAERAVTFDNPDWRRGYDAGRAELMWQYQQLEIQNEKLLAKVYGYVNRMATEPPGNPKGMKRKGREWRKIRHRTPYLLRDGSWVRAKGQVKREDYAQKFPPRPCENCGELFAPGRSDARTCTPACRVALHRKRGDRGQAKLPVEKSGLQE